MWEVFLVFLVGYIIGLLCAIFDFLINVRFNKPTPNWVFNISTSLMGYCGVMLVIIGIMYLMWALIV